MNHYTVSDMSIPIITAEYVFEPEGTVLYNHYSGMAGRSVVRSFSGIENPSFKDQIMNHLDATTPYEARDVKIGAHSAGSASVRSTLYPQPPRLVTQDGDFCLAYVPDLTEIDVSSCLNDASTEFFQKASKAVNGFTILGELRETLALIRKPAKALRSAVDQYKHKNAIIRNKIIVSARAAKQNDRHARKAYRQAVSDSYLEWQWGIKPLVSDIEGLYKTLLQRLDEPHITRVKIRKQVVRNSPETLVDDHVLYGSLRSEYFRSGTTTTQVQLKAGIITRVDSSVSLDSALGLTPDEFIPAAWELLPYSWAIDYFSNTGDVINAYFIARNLRYSYVSQTIRIKEVTNVRCKFSPYYFDDPISPWVMQGNNPGSATVETKIVRRTAPGVVPLPSWEYTGPLSPVQQSLNVTALVASRNEDRVFRSGLRL